jgi:hypothetical protein
MTITLAVDPLPGPLSGVTSDYLARLGSRIIFAGSDGYNANSEPWALALGTTASIARSGALAPRADGAAPASAAASRPTDGPARGEVTGAGGPGAVVLAAETLSIEGVVPPVQNPPVCVEMAGAVCVREGSSVSFKVTLTSGTGGHANDVFVDYHTVAVTAKPGTDFVEKVTFAPGIHTLTHTPLRFAATTSSTPQTITVTISTVNDLFFEDHYKSFAVEIFNPTEGTIVTPRAEAWVENEDVPGPDGPYWPTVSLDSVTVTESATNPPFALFEATLNRPSETTTRLYWTSGVGGEDPPADPALDYREMSGFFVFRPGETTHSTSVETFDDTIDEPNEKFWVDLGTTTNWGAWVGVGRGVGLINDNDSATLAIADAGSIPEGDTGTTDATFNITISTPYYRDFTLAYTTVDGTAKAGLDYTPVLGTLFFPKGATQRSLTVPVLGDVLDESNEGFTLVLSNSTGPSISDASGAATITDDDTTVSIADASVTEAAGTGTSTLTFTVSTADPNGNKTPFTVDYATADGGAQPATAGADYVATAGTLSFPAATRSRTFTVTVNGDLIDEPAETFLVHLSNSSGPAILDGDAVGTINDNDTATVTINNISVTEGNSGTTDAVFTISLNTPYYRDFTLNWATAAGTVNPATEGVDYLAAGGPVTFTAGTTTQTVAVPVVGDVLDEPNETFAVVLSNSTGPAISDSRGDATITDDDVVTIDTADVSVVEGNSGTTPATFTVTVSGDHTQTITVTVVTSGGGPTPPAATVGTDYTSLPSTVLTFGPGVVSQTVSVSVIGDTVAEASNESFGLTLSAPTGGAVLARTKALGVILDDDSDRVISFSPTSVSVTEPLSFTTTASFSVSLNAAAGRTVTVDFATADGTALAGSDYTAASGTLSFEPGDLTKSIAVTVLSDSLVEAVETFTLVLSNPTNATIAAGAGTATGRIADSISLVPMGFYTVTPCRVVDTRRPAPGSPLVGGVTRTFPFAGVCGIPSTARAVSVNVTVTGTSAEGNVRLFPGGTPPPSTSTVNVKAAQTRANNGMVTLGTAGDVGVMLAPAGATGHVIIDVNGYLQ